MATTYVLRITLYKKFELIRTTTCSEGIEYFLPPSEQSVCGNIVLSGYLTTSLPCGVLNAGWSCGYRSTDDDTQPAIGTIAVNSGKCTIYDAQGDVLYELSNAGVIRGLHNPAYSCDNNTGTLVTVSYSLSKPDVTVLNLYAKAPRTEKKYDGYPFFCDTNGYFDGNGFPTKVEIYDEDDNFRGWGYQMFYTWEGGGVDPATGHIISGYPQCLYIGRDVGEYSFEFEGRFNPNSEENKPYFSDVDLEEVEVSVRFVRPYVAEIKPRELTFKLSDIVFNDKVYDCLPLTYEREVTVTVGGDGFAVYEDNEGNPVIEGADFNVTFDETPAFSKDVNEDGYFLTYGFSLEGIIPWNKTPEYPERGDTKLSNYTYEHSNVTTIKRAFITPATISLNHPQNITKTYDCKEVPFLTQDTIELSGVLDCDIGKVYVGMSRQSHGITSIVDVGVYSVSYNYNLRGTASGNYVLDNESDTVTITIEKRPLTITVDPELAIVKSDGDLTPCEEKEYDGTKLGVIEPGVIVENLASCDVGKIWVEPEIEYKPEFEKNVGTYKATVKKYEIKASDGAKLSNYDYELPGGTSVTGRITPRTLLLSELEDITKVYDCQPVELPEKPEMLNKVAGDDLYLTVTRSANGSDFIDAKNYYSVRYNYTLEGTDAGNYVLDSQRRYDVLKVIIEKRCPGITVTQELEIDYEEKVYDGEELHVIEPVVSLTNLASCDVDKIWIEPVVTYTPRTFTKDVGTYKAEVRYYIRYNGAKTSNYIWDGDEECDGMPSTASVQGAITPLKLEDFDCPSCIAEEGEENSGECVWAKQTYNGSELQYSITAPEFDFLDGDEVTVSVSVSGSGISKVYDLNNKLVGIKTASPNVKTYPVTLSYTISGKDAKNYELPDNLSCSGSLVIVCKTIEIPEITGEYVNGNIRLSHKDLDGVIDNDKTKVALLMDYHIEYDTGTTIKITVTPTLTGTQAQNYCMEGQEVPVYISKTGGGGSGGGGQGGGDDPGGGGGQGGSHGTQTQVKHEKPIIAPLGEGAKWDYGELFSFYNPNTHILTVRVSIPLDYYNKYLVAYYPSYVRVLVSSIGDVQTRITRYSFDGSAYDDSTGGDSYIPSVGVYQTGHTWDRRTEYNQIYWEFDFVVDDTGSHNATYVSERNKVLSNVDLQIYAWAFGNNLKTSDIASATFKMTKTEPLPPEIGDISVFLVDTPTTELNEDEWGSGWESEDTPHTLANAIRYAQDNATILFAGSLMENQQEKPVVSSNVIYTLDFAVTIDASKPYKIIRNENNEQEIVVDDTIENWNGVIVGDCGDRLFDIRTITNNPVTLKNIHFKEGFCAINASTPVYVYDCIIENFSSYSIFVQSDFKISRCIFKNCGNATGLRGEGCIDDCLFESSQKVFPVKGHLAKIYNCTIVAPTGILKPYATTGLTHLDYFNCFISGYPIKYSTADTLDETYIFYNRVARNNIILHTNAKPSLDSPILNDNEEDITADCIKTYNEAFGENNAFNNEVYELSGTDNNPTTSNFLYRNYRPRSKGNYVVVDKGNNAYIQSETDLAGNPRVWQDGEDTQGIVDIGCYEHIPYSALPSIHLSATETITEEDSELYHNDFTYDSKYHNVFDVVDDTETKIKTTDITVYVLPEEFDFATDSFDWSDIDDLEEIIEYYDTKTEEIYGVIPTVKHVTIIEENEEYKWGLAHNVVVVVPGYRGCYGKVNVTVSPKPLYLFDFSITGSPN